MSPGAFHADLLAIWRNIYVNMQLHRLAQHLSHWLSQARPCWLVQRESVCHSKSALCALHGPSSESLYSNAQKNNMMFYTEHDCPSFPSFQRKFRPQ